MNSNDQHRSGVARGKSKTAPKRRRSLSLMGVTDSQMEAVSLGKEKPQATGHDESSWAQNRRADLVYQQ